MTALSFAGVGCLLVFAGEPMTTGGPLTPDVIESLGGNTYAVGMTLFTQYLWPFELASILILLAIVASIVIAKKDSSPKKRRG